MTKLPNRIQNAFWYAWVFANASARTGASGEVEPTDVGQVALQVDDMSIWFLSDDSPLTWVQIGGSGGGSLPALGVASVIVGKPETSSKVRGTTTGWSHNTTIDYGTFPQDMVDDDAGTSVGFEANAGGIIITRDFGADVEVSGVRLSQDGGGDPSGRAQWKLQSSDNNSSWTDRYVSDDPAPGDSQLRRLDGDVTIEARYWRIWTAAEDDTGSTWNVRGVDLWGPDGTDVGSPIVIDGDLDQVLRCVTDTAGGKMIAWRNL